MELLKEYIDLILQERKFNNNHLFIRFGRFGKNSRSKVGLDTEFRKDVLSGKQFEEGLSVYFAKPHKDGYWLQEPNRRRAAYGLSYNYLGDMFKNIFMSSLYRRDIFLVQGDLIEEPSREEDEDGNIYYTGSNTYAVGSDGEPVIENVRIVKRLEPSEVYIDAFGEKTIQDLYGKQIDDEVYDDSVTNYLELSMSNEELRDEFQTNSDPDLIYQAEREFKKKGTRNILDLLSDLWDKGTKIDPNEFLKISFKVHKKAKDVNKTLEILKYYFIK